MSIMGRKTPVFIQGAAHSGTTILYKMLGYHPDVTWFSQFSQRDGKVKGRFRMPFMKTWDKFSRNAFRYNWQKKEGKLGLYFFPRPTEADSVWEYAIPRHGATEESVQRVRDVVNSELKSAKKDHLLVKLPRLYQYTALLKEAHPGAKFIHIIRDGRALAESCRHKFTWHSKSYSDALYRSGQYWNNVLEVMKGHEALEFRYEDFCADVHGHLRKVLDYVGLSTEKFPFEKVPKELKVTNQKRLAKISSEELKALEAVQGKHLKEQGYLK